MDTPWVKLRGYLHPAGARKSSTPTGRDGERACAWTASRRRSRSTDADALAEGERVGGRRGTAGHERDRAAAEDVAVVADDVDLVTDALVDDADADRARAHEHRERVRRLPPALGVRRAHVHGVGRDAQHDRVVAHAVGGADDVI